MLSPKQRAHLRSLAHRLKPLLHVGKEGVTDTTLQALEDAFRNREILKVKVSESAPASAREVGDLLEQRVEAVHHVQTIGRTVVLYRPHPENPEIALPPR